MASSPIGAAGRCGSRRSGARPSGRRHEGTRRSPGVLLKHHGVFAVGPTALEAVKAAVMVEDIAATVWTALQIGATRGDPRCSVVPWPLPERCTASERDGGGATDA